MDDEPNDAEGPLAAYLRAGRGASATERSPQALSRRAAIFKALELTSFFHSCVYLGLLICAFAAGSPQPAAFVLGLTHGLLWIAMSLACIAAARWRIVPLRLAVAVAVLGGVGPFFGSIEFLRLSRKRGV